MGDENGKSVKPIGPNGAYGSSEENQEETNRRFITTLRDRTPKWVSGVGGGFLGGLTTILFLIIPVVNTWIANAKEISLAQVRNSAEQIEYITRRMQDSDKERDLYKSEMLQCQQELRALKK